MKNLERYQALQTERSRMRILYLNKYLFGIILIVKTMVSEVKDRKIKYGKFYEFYNAFLYYMFIKKISFESNNIFINYFAFYINYSNINLSMFALISPFAGQFLEQVGINKLLQLELFSNNMPKTISNRKIFNTFLYSYENAVNVVNDCFDTVLFFKIELNNISHYIYIHNSKTVMDLKQLISRLSSVAESTFYLTTSCKFLKEDNPLHLYTLNQNSVIVNFRIRGGSVDEPDNNSNIFTVAPVSQRSFFWIRIIHQTLGSCC